MRKEKNDATPKIKLDFDVTFIIIFCIPGAIITLLVPSYTIEFTRVNPERVDATVSKNLLIIVPISRYTATNLVDTESEVIGTGVRTGGGMHVPIKSDYFKIVRGREENIIFWTAGTGDIGPIPFEFNDNDYMIEMERMAYGREEAVKLGKNELSISRTDEATD